MERILVPSEFSIPAREALTFAFELASMTKGEVFVLHVVDLPLMHSTASGVQNHLFDKATQLEMVDLANRKFEILLNETGVSSKEVEVHFHLDHGGVVSKIHEYVCNQNIDLVVMATHGAGSFRELLLGSTTEKILRISPVPVITVKKSFAPESLKNIVFPTNLSLGQNEFIKKVKEIQQLFKSKLHVLFVNTPGNFQRDKEINENLEKFCEHFQLEDYTLNIRNDLYEEFGIINFAKEIKMDLIAMGTHGRKGLAHLVIGSIAEDVLNNVQCAVWTYKIKK